MDKQEGINQPGDIEEILTKLCFFFSKWKYFKEACKNVFMISPDKF